MIFLSYPMPLHGGALVSLMNNATNQILSAVAGVLHINKTLRYNAYPAEVGRSKASELSTVGVLLSSPL